MYFKYIEISDFWITPYYRIKKQGLKIEFTLIFVKILRIYVFKTIVLIWAKLLKIHYSGGCFWLKVYKTVGYYRIDLGLKANFWSNYFQNYHTMIGKIEGKYMRLWFFTWNYSLLSLKNKFYAWFVVFSTRNVACDFFFFRNIYKKRGQNGVTG